MTATPPPDRDDLWNTFVDPDDEARPRAWWHWMDGNIDAEGITRDLRWLHEVGVRGVQTFDGGMGVPLVVPEAVRPGTRAWEHAIQVVARTTAELGMELTVATSAGWSAAGGPWVEPGDAMKKLVWSEMSAEGGKLIEVELPPLPEVAGLYQDSPRWGVVDPIRWVKDWAVVAFPSHVGHDPLHPLDVRASSPLGNVTALTDRSFSETVVLPRDPDAWSSAWIQQEFREAVTVRSVVVGLPGPRGFGAAPPPDALLEASDDGVVFRPVAALEPTTVPARTVSFPPVTARIFRLVLSGDSAAAALPQREDGVRLPPVLRPATSFLISEFALRSGGRIHHSETKSGFGAEIDYYRLDTDPAAEFATVSAKDVVDLTQLVRDGRLTWEAPPGRWRILRLGASPTGQTNGPALADATGLEVDKLDGVRVASYLERYLERFGDAAAGQPGSGGISALLSDSIESGPQNWTDAIRAEFRERRGYDLAPWLPALMGFVVDGAAASDRFLFDYRRTLSELFAEEYYGTLARAAHARGWTYYAEALEDGRPQLGDDLAMRSWADVPMGAMWTFAPDDGPRPTYVADLKGASSVSHVNGKSWTGSEAFTSFDSPWSSSPRSLKHVADLQLSLGVTRFCIHTSPHQPLAAPPPGIALAPFLGQAFTINETWSALARPWIDYLARCSAVLNVGAPAVDIAVFVGEEAPVTGLFDSRLDAAVPSGFDFDYVGPDALGQVLGVEDGEVTSVGARYRLLFLGGSTRRMTISALRQIERLLDAGATVVGLAPESSPSLADDPAEFESLRDGVWSASRGLGTIVATADLASALSELGIRPALGFDGPPVRTIGRILEGRRLTFVANPSGEPAVVGVSVDTGSPALVMWDPVDLRRVPLRAESASPDGRRRYLLNLPPFGSAFLVEDQAWTPQPAAAASGGFTTPRPLVGPWTVELPGSQPMQSAPHAQLWTEISEAARGFSGTGVYRHEFTLSDVDASGERVMLALGDVRDIARVVVNGADCGIAWAPPFRVEVTTALREGENLVEVHVTNPWRNRLIAEAAAPTGSVFRPMTEVFEAAAPPMPAGLAGPVSLVRED